MTVLGATGLGGRARRSGAPTERARIAVRKAIAARLPRSTDTIRVSLVDTGVTNPAASHWERAFQLFDLLL